MILYGSTKSRAARCAVALVELGVAFEHVPLKPFPGSDDRKRLMSLNPNCHIPVHSLPLRLVDGDGLNLPY
jgi:glutathione S-transferase